MRPTPIEMRVRYQVRRNRRLVEPAYVRFASAIQQARIVETSPGCVWVDIVKYPVEPTGATPTAFRQVGRGEVVWRGGRLGNLVGRIWRALVG